MFSKLNGCDLHPTGLNIAQSVEHRTGITEVMGSSPVGASDFFPGLSLQLL